MSRDLAHEDGYRRKIKTREELRTIIGSRPRERKVIMTECDQQKGGKKGGKSKSAKKEGDKPKSPKASNKLSSMTALID